MTMPLEQNEIAAPAAKRFPGLGSAPALSSARTKPRVIAPKGLSGPQPSAFLSLIRSNIALSMVGRVVDLMVNAENITHGLVTAVRIEDGAPKLVVGGSGYDLSQVLTVIPASLN